jgi:hypothetical protein
VQGAVEDKASLKNEAMEQTLTINNLFHLKTQVSCYNFRLIDLFNIYTFKNAKTILPFVLLLIYEYKNNNLTRTI